MKNRIRNWWWFNFASYSCWFFPIGFLSETFSVAFRTREKTNPILIKQIIVERNGARTKSLRVLSKKICWWNCVFSFAFRDKSEVKNYCFAHEEFLANSQTLMKFLICSHFLATLAWRWCSLNWVVIESALFDHVSRAWIVCFNHLRSQSKRLNLLD